MRVPFGFIRYYNLYVLEVFGKFEVMGGRGIKGGSDNERYTPFLGEIVVHTCTH
jgi:hypothetical protein